MSNSLSQPNTHTQGVYDLSQHHGGFSNFNVEEGLDKGLIAELSPIQISQMSRNELVRVIQAADMPLLCKDVQKRLELYDRDTLEQLVFMARRCCRHQGY